MRMKRGRTEASTLYPDLNSVRPYADSTRTGLEAAPAKYEAEYTTSETHIVVARDAP